MNSGTRAGPFRLWIQRVFRITIRGYSLVLSGIGYFVDYYSSRHWIEISIPVDLTDPSFRQTVTFEAYRMERFEIEEHKETGSLSAEVTRPGSGCILLTLRTNRMLD